MSFHLGKPILVMILISLVGAVAVSLRPSQRPADLTVWVFAEAHHRAYKPVIADYERRTGTTINLNLVQFRALNVRLGSLFMSDPLSDQIPDIVEVEIGTVGRYFRPPMEEIGFRPLNDYLFEKTDLGDKIIKARLATWTKNGVVFGIPHDVHPVAICYREDLFREAGIDLSAARTWPEFHEKCVEFENYWRGRGFPYRHAIELPESDAGYVVVMLLQQHINLVDHDNRIYLTDPKVARTVAFYARMVAGSRAVAGQSSGGRGGMAKDMADGNLCSFITPDWRYTYLKIDGPELAGKMRLMPLPIFDPGDAPTSTWGGTMIGITRACKNPDAAWKLIEALYISKEGLESRMKISNVLPPVKSLWDMPVFQQPDPYCGGQHVFQLYIKLAEQLPERLVTPASGIAQAELTEVLNRAVSYVRSNGSDGLEAACQQWLEERAQSLARRMTHASFDRTHPVTIARSSDAAAPPPAAGGKGR